MHACMQFVASLGRGPASLLWHVSGWTLTSISGFSTAASHVLKRSLAAPPTKQYVTLHLPVQVASALALARALAWTPPCV